jgi:two-component system, cell cycle sensor histidine kinase and response regulator CckA
MRVTTIMETTAAITREPSALAPERKQGSPRRREHILIVDDERLIVQTTKEMLESLGFRVTTSTNGEEALEMVRRRPHSFNLVITDYVMPLMNGLELARALTQLRPELPVILFTGYSKGISAENARELGLADYLKKPLQVAELHQAIRRALDAPWAGEKATGSRKVEAHPCGR